MNNLISRQAAIDMLKNRWKKTRNYEGIGDDIAEECELYLKQVPSAPGMDDIRLFGEYMILPDIPTPDEKQEIADELMKKLLNDLQKSGCVEFVWHLDGEIKTVGVKMYVAMPKPYKEKP